MTSLSMRFSYWRQAVLAASLVTGRAIAERMDRPLTAAEFHQLAAVPAEAEWFANLDNPRTRRAYRTDLQDFLGFAGIWQPGEFRIVTRAHVVGVQNCC
ncbi:hypothetical protein [Paraburkholderia sediminicola]|uniref:hypothetical protein n=1 Tax=Paraburkholderia sediminicola TaxID=458836 RepID=UPI0038BCBCD0